MKEIGYYRFPDGDTWSAKTPRIDAATGDFYLYGNDIARGLDIYAFDGQAAKSATGGRWLTPAQALARVKPRVKLTPSSAFYCLLPG